MDKAAVKRAERIAEGRRLRLRATAGVADTENGYVAEREDGRRGPRHGATPTYELEPLPSEQPGAEQQRS